MGPYASADTAMMNDERYDRALAAAREAFGREWDIVETLGGLVAVPRGAEVIAAITLDGMVRKLREREQ